MAVQTVQPTVTTDIYLRLGPSISGHAILDIIDYRFECHGARDVQIVRSNRSHRGASSADFCEIHAPSIRLRIEFLIHGSESYRTYSVDATVATLKEGFDRMSQFFQDDKEVFTEAIARVADVVLSSHPIIVRMSPATARPKPRSSVAPDRVQPRKQS
jgi:hypothetical protein